VQVVQFVGKPITNDDATEWMVTRAILSYSVAIASSERIRKHNQRVNALMRAQGLVHIGWLRVVAQGGPLSLADVNTQKVCCSF
jgi:hypothetical protein